MERAWQVPKDTLARRVKGDGPEAGWKHASGKKPILSQQAERELVELVMMLSKRGFPLRRKHVQRLAFEYRYATEHSLRGFNTAKGRCSLLLVPGVLIIKKRIALHEEAGSTFSWSSYWHELPSRFRLVKFFFF